jgi:hypothetical protein
MGRDARLARALAADNRGNRGRIVLAHGACVTTLAGDLRVQEHYRTWRATQERRFHDGPPSWARTEAAVERALEMVRQADIDALALVLHAMGVPWRWCADALVLSVFPIMRHNDEHPTDRRALHVSAPSADMPLGRLPRHLGREITRNVRWWYRADIKDPKDELHVLVKEYLQDYAKSAHRSPEAHSVVRNGIEQAKTLLNLVIDPSAPGWRVLK